jgi:hypothetical protein
VVVWIIRLLIAAAAAGRCPVVRRAPAALRVGAAHALLSLAVFVGTPVALVLLALAQRAP